MAVDRTPNDWYPLDPNTGDLLQRMLVRAREMPAFPAVVTADGEAITYAELVGRAAALAPILRERAVDGVVGVIGGFDLFVPIAIVAAAIAQVRLVVADAGDPPQRLSALFRSVGCPALTTERYRAAVDALDTGLVRSIVAVPDAAAEIDGLRGEPTVLVTTSGSTSAPKVAVLPRLRWQLAAADTSARFCRCRLVVAGVGTYGFISGLTTSFRRGRTAALFDPRVGSVAEMLDFLERHDVDSLAITTTMVHTLARAVDGGALGARIGYVNIRGERVNGTDLAALHALVPAAEIVHQFASTEAGTIAKWAWRPGDPIPDGPLPLGPPVESVAICFLDDDGRPTEPRPGTPRELAVKSEKIFEGYVGTADDGCFTDDDGGRWFRTGDLVSIDESGSLRVHGRLGRRVKVAGQFVDLDDVADTLERFGGVSQAAVTSFDDHGVVRLVGHLVPDGDAEVDPVRVRARLAESLPFHMVPSLMRVVPHPPLNRSGKLDHLELGRWRPTSAPADAREVARVLASPTESHLLALAAELIGRPVGLDDDLIDAGMVSIGWVELVERLRIDFGRELGLNRVLAVPTARGIAEIVTADGPVPAMVRLTTGERLPSIVWFVNGLAASEAVPVARALAGRPVWVPTPKGFGRPGEMAFRVADAVDDAIEAISGEGPSGPLVVVGFSAGCHHAQALAARLVEQGRDVVLLVLLDPPGGHRRWPGSRQLRQLELELRAWWARNRLRRRTVTGGEKAPHWLWVAMRREQFKSRLPAYGGATLVIRSAALAGHQLPAGLTGPVQVERIDGDHWAVITDAAVVADLIETAIASATS
ncbi:MAG TPA: alpha/beta fold hydrolase [Ilumatobacter sp.]